MVNLEKIEELGNAKHKGNIDVNSIMSGELLAEPEVGACCVVLMENQHYFRTSRVYEIIDNNTFKTCNSIYRIHR